ncbi:MAG: hypothetical protein HY741_08960 [Chloroflexi bacterium]|nr:hypothetical protein [Chloroflexota bacterium]
MLTQQDLVVQELRTLRDDQVGEVLDFIRFLKFRSVSDQELRNEFWRAVNQARDIAAARGITEDDIAEEIRQVRAEQ